MTWRLGIDIGGTFTDFALLDQAGQKLAIHKQLTTPSRPICDSCYRWNSRDIEKELMCQFQMSL